MTRDKLQEFIKLYKETEKSVTELDDKFGINIWNSRNPNFYNNYNLIIRNLLIDIFDEKKIEVLEDYLFDQIKISFNELCEILGI